MSQTLICAFAKCYLMRETQTYGIILVVIVFLPDIQRCKKHVSQTELHELILVFIRAWKELKTDLKSMKRVI